MTWRSPDAEDRRVAALWGVCAGLVVLFRPVWLAGAKVLPHCLWRTWTGWPCPGCGTTRAMTSLLHGELAHALAFNPLAALAGMTFLAGGLAAPLWLAAGGQAVSLSARPRPLAMAALAALFLANWAWLYASGV